MDISFFKYVYDTQLSLLKFNAFEFLKTDGNLTSWQDLEIIQRAITWKICEVTPYCKKDEIFGTNLRARIMICSEPNSSPELEADEKIGNEFPYCLYMILSISLSPSCALSQVEKVSKDRIDLTEVYYFDDSLIPILTKPEENSIAKDVLNIANTKNKQYSHLDSIWFAKSFGVEVVLRKGCTPCKTLLKYYGDDEGTLYVTTYDDNSQDQPAGVSVLDVSIIHGCVHWLLHRRIAYLAKLLKVDFKILCHVDRSANNFVKYDIIESQANTITTIIKANIN